MSGPYRPDTRDDAALIAAIVAGETDSFRELVRRYEGVVAQTVIGMLGPGDDAEEAGQLTMIKVYRSLGTFKGESSFKTYLTRIAMNTALDELRRRERERRRFRPAASTADDDPLEDVADSRDEIAGADAGRLVTQALNRLSPEFRAVVVLRLIRGLDAEEAAQSLGVSVGTIHSRLSRARGQLIEYLGPEYGLSDG